MIIFLFFRHFVVYLLEYTTVTVRTIEMNITGMLTPTGNLKPNLKTSPSLFTHAKSAQSVNHDINTRLWRFGFKKKIGSLSEGSIPVVFISMVRT
jgi:hypothetical protein